MKKQVINYETKLWACYEIKNPFEVLDAFIDHARTDYYKQILSQAILYTQKQEVYNKDASGQLFIFHAALRSFLRACYRLYYKRKNWNVKPANPDCKSVLHQAALNKEEYKNPLIVFHNAFTENTLYELENKLAEIVYLALLPQQADYTTDLSTAYIQIVKLLDAAQLIRERGLEKSKKETTPVNVVQQQTNAIGEIDTKVVTVGSNNDEDEKQKEPQSEAPEVEVEQQEHKNEIAAIITTTIPTCGIYCFGERNTNEDFASVHSETKNSNTTHYYLLVIVQTMTQNATGELANIIKMETKGRYTATLLIHTLRDLRRNKTKQGYFFQQVIVEGVTWFENWEKTGPLKFASVSKRTFKEIERYWLDRKIAVDAFIDAALALNNNAAPLQLSFFHQAVEHLCLGLIHTFLGYRPHYFALGYLFDLCELFTPITSQFFPRKTKEELAIFKTFFRPFSDLHHMKIGEKELPHLSLIEVHCMEFYEQAIRIMEVELERLKSVE